MKFGNKVLVITGAGSGIGYALTKLALSRGAQVAAVDLHPGALAQLRRDMGSPPTLSTHTLDISDRTAVAALPDEVLAAHGVVDVLINNAGIIQPFQRVEQLDYDTIDRVMNVNFMGTLYMVKAFLPLLRQRPVAHIANVSSMGGFFPFPGQTVYGASKAAVKLLTEGLYAELLDTNVGVSVVMPGAVATSITENSGVAAPDAEGAKGLQPTEPETAARVILDGIAGNKLHVYVGNDSRAMSLAIKLAPKQATKLVQKQMKGLIETPEST